MSLKLYNTRTRSVETFVPLKERHVRIYVCGLTPSAEAHLGHARSFLFFDVLRRYLESSGYALTFVQNVTDIDDRSINRARETGEDWRAIVQAYFDSFKASMRRLHVREPDREPRATEYIPQIVAMVERLMASGAAYTTPDGVYYSVATFTHYGELSRRKLEELEAGARIEVDEDKRDPLDFALWKFAKPGEPSWESPWGAGRPGWHIECSAMSWELLGEQFDIHGGGFDLIFPHHENEIAQTEALSHKRPMANFWLHGGLLLFDQRKMSKSLGNFEPLSALLDRHDPQAIRLLFLQTGYRKPMNFTEESVAGATSGLRRLLAGYDALAAAAQDAAPNPDFPPAVAARESFRAEMDDDLNTSAALAGLFDLVEAKCVAPPADAAALRDVMREAMTILGIAPEERARREGSRFAPDFLDRLKGALGGELALNGVASEPEAIGLVLAERTHARAAKDFARSDRLRDALVAAGVSIKDGKDGTTWTVDP